MVNKKNINSYEIIVISILHILLSFRKFSFRLTIQSISSLRQHRPDRYVRGRASIYGAGPRLVRSPRTACERRAGPRDARKRNRFPFTRIYLWAAAVSHPFVWRRDWTLRHVHHSEETFIRVHVDDAPTVSRRCCRARTWWRGMTSLTTRRYFFLSLSLFFLSSLSPYPDRKLTFSSRSVERVEGRGEKKNKQTNK